MAPDSPSFICNCCSCCELLAGVQAGYSDGVGKTGLLLEVDAEKCVGCGLCAKACNVAALAVNQERQLQIEQQVCLGCGACIPSCPKDALRMVTSETPEIPHKKRDLMKQILREKKRMTPYVVDGVVQKVKKVLPKSSNI